MLNSSVRLIDPADCFAVVVGVGSYANGNQLPSATENALSFACMLGQLGLPTTQICLFVAAAPQEQLAKTYRGKPEIKAILDLLATELRKRTESTLLFYWSGHGITSTSPRWYGRRLFTADYDQIQWNLNFEAMANYFRENHWDDTVFEHQFFWIDACGTTPTALGWDEEPADHTVGLPRGITKARPPHQDIIFSAAEGRSKLAGELGRPTLFTKTLIDLIRAQRSGDGRLNFSSGQIYDELRAALVSAKMTEPQRRISFQYPRDDDVIGKSATSGGCFELPRLSPTYLRRKEEFDSVMEALDAKNRFWGAAIAGPGGVGKSALAVEVATACWSEGRFGRIICTSAKNQEFVPTEGKTIPASGQLTELNGLIDAILRASGNSAACEGSMDDRILEARDALQKVPCLLVIDNLETLSSIDSLKNFLKHIHWTTKLITTTRDARLRWGEELVNLRSMSQTQAFQLVGNLCSFKKISEIEPADVAKIYRLAGGIPLAIEWCVSRSSRSPEFLTELERFFRGSGQDTELEQLLKYLFDLSFDQLASTSRVVLEVLGLISIPLNFGEILEVTRLKSSETHMALGELDQVSLLVQDSWIGGGNVSRYTVLPLVRRFLRSRIATETQREILTRFAESRSSGNGKICVFTPGFLPVMLPDGSCALDFAYGVHTDIGNSFKTAIADGSLLAAASKLHCGQIVDVQTHGGEPLAAWKDLVVSEKARRALDRYFNRQHRTRRFVQKGNASALQRRVDAARLSFQAACRVSSESVWPISRLAHQHRVDGEVDAAKALFERIIARDSKNRFALCGLGAMSYMSGDFGKGADYYSHALKSDDTYINARFGLARCQCHQLKYGKALATLAGNLVPPTVRARLWPSMLFVRAIAELASGSGEKAIEHTLTEVLATFSRLVGKVERGNRMASHFGFHYAYTLACVGSEHWKETLLKCLNPRPAPGLAVELEQDFSLLTPTIIAILDRELKRVLPNHAASPCISALKSTLFQSSL